MTWRADVTHPYMTGLPTDVIVNTWHFDRTFGASAPDESDFAALETLLKNFYGSIFTTSSQSGMAPWVNQALKRTTIYDLTDPTPRAPVYENVESGIAVQSGSSSTPLEVAICLSYQGAKISGVPQARRRGRIFIGGIGNAAVATTGLTFPTPTPEITSNLCQAANSLMVNGNIAQWTWGVYSRVGNSFTPTVDGWVDNAFDTQRRRGNAPTGRSFFDVTGP
jgi:hypothetical protein